MADDEENNSSEDLKEMKRRERLEQNRISARESRKRKKTMIEELQRTVIGLSRDNKDFNDRNETLRRQLMELGTKYPQFVPLHAIMGGSSTGFPQPMPGQGVQNGMPMMAQAAVQQQAQGAQPQPDVQQFQQQFQQMQQMQMQALQQQPVSNSATTPPPLFNGTEQEVPKEKAESKEASTEESPRV